MDNLADGIQPFALVIQDHSTTDSGLATTTARQRAEEYDILTHGFTSTSLEDARTIRKGKIKLPSDYTQTRAHITAQVIMHRALFGATHTMTTSLQKFLVSFSNRELFYRGRLQAAIPTQGPATLLRYIQLHVVNWHRDLACDGALPDAPAYGEILKKLSVGDKSWVPTLPDVWKQSYTPPPTDTGTIISDLTPAATRTSGSRTGTSGETPDTNTRTESTAIINPAIAPILASYKNKLGRSRILEAVRKAGGPPPKVTRGASEVQMCIAYHIKGTCWSQCRRRKDHATHTQEEDQLLVDWCVKAFD